MVNVELVFGFSFFLLSEIRLTLSQLQDVYLDNGDEESDESSDSESEPKTKRRKIDRSKERRKAIKLFLQFFGLDSNFKVRF